MFMRSGEFDFEVLHTVVLLFLFSRAMRPVGLLLHLENTRSADPSRKLSPAREKKKAFTKKSSSRRAASVVL